MMRLYMGDDVGGNVEAVIVRGHRRLIVVLNVCQLTFSEVDIHCGSHVLLSYPPFASISYRHSVHDPSL